VNGEGLGEALVAKLEVLVRGEGVRGIRPPAVLLEKMPCCFFKGVDTDAVAIVIYGVQMQVEWTTDCSNHCPVC